MPGPHGSSSSSDSPTTARPPAQDPTEATGPAAAPSRTAPPSGAWTAPSWSPAPPTRTPQPSAGAPGAGTRPGSAQHDGRRPGDPRSPAPGTTTRLRPSTTSRTTHHVPKGQTHEQDEQVPDRVSPVPHRADQGRADARRGPDRRREPDPAGQGPRRSPRQAARGDPAEIGRASGRARGDE